MSESFYTRAASGMRWTAAAHGSRQFVLLAALAALTRLLEPDDFGLMSMTMVFVGFAQLFHELGTGSAIIQRASLNDRLLSSLFWVNVGGGAVLFAALVIAAPLIADFFGDERLNGLLPLVAATLLVTAPGVVPKALLRRRLRFRALARIDMIAVVVGAAAAIVAATRGAGAAALAVQALAIHSVATVGMFIAGSWRPRLVFSWTELRAVSGYTTNLTGYNICAHLIRHADYLIIGKLAGAEALGFYTVAYQIMLYPLRHIASVVMRVVYPVYARLRDDHKRLRHAFCRTSANIATVTFPLMTGVAVVAGPFVRTVFGEQWNPAVVVLILLAPVGLAQSLLATCGVIFQVVGRTGVFFLWTLCVGACTVGGFLIGVRWGAPGVAATYLVVTIALAAPTMMISFRHIGLSIGRFLRSIRQPAVCAAAMGAIVLIGRAALGGNLADIEILVVFVPIGAVSYVVLSWMWNRRGMHDLLGVAIPQLRATAC